MDNSTYVIRGGLEGRERLRVLSRVMWPATSALFDRVAIAPDANCLDVGCGSGDVTIALAQRAPQGRTVGVIITEDIDFRGHFCHPDSAAFDRYIDWYSSAVRARGCDPDIGPRLPSLLLQAGLADIDMHVVQPAGCDNEAKQITPITLEAIADSVLAAQLTTPQIMGETVDELYEFANDPTTVMSIPRIVQAWGTWLA